MILEETYRLLKLKYEDLIKDLTISDVRLGIYLSAVKLSDGSSGVASTLPDEQCHCIKKNRDFEDFTPAKIRGQRVTHLFNITKESHIIDTLRIAVLNAISSTILANGSYNIIEDKDPIELVDLEAGKTITIVGAFSSYIQKVSETSNRLNVLELDENALPGEFRKYYVPAADYHRVLQTSDLVIITGLTLVNNTIDGLLTSIPDKSQVIVTGPSSSLVPDVLFRNKVKIIGATRITDPDMLFTIAGEAGAGYHLFRYCARKICIVNDQGSRYK